MKRNLALFAVVSFVCAAAILSFMNGNASAQTTPSNYEIRMLDGMKFDNAALEIKVGDTVTWINASPVKHSATSDADSELKFAEQDLATGKFSATRVKFDTAGKASYHCKYHPSMKGTITVN